MENKDNISIEYPYNLITAIKGTTDLELPITSEENVRSALQYVLSTLDFQERLFVNMRYVEKKDLDETGAYFGMDAKTVNSWEKKILRKFRQPTKWGFIQYGVEGYLRRRITEAGNNGYHKGFSNGYQLGISDGRAGMYPEKVSDNILDLPLEMVELTTTAFNALTRSGYLRIRDIVDLKEGEIIRIRNLGNKSIKDVARMLRRKGIYHTKWETAQY